MPEVGGGVVDDPGAGSVDHRRDWLVAGDGLHPARHRVHRDVGARHERQGEHQHRHALGGLGRAGDEADGDEHPREGEAEAHAEPDGDERVEHRARGTEADRQPDRRSDGDTPGHECGLAQGPPGGQRRPGNWERPEPVDDAALDVLGDAGRGGHPGEQHAGDDESRDHEVDIAHAVGGADGAAEHVAEDEQEHRPLDGGDDEELRSAGEGGEGAPGDDAAAGEEPGAAHPDRMSVVDGRGDLGAVAVVVLMMLSVRLRAR